MQWFCAHMQILQNQHCSCTEKETFFVQTLIYTTAFLQEKKKTVFNNNKIKVLPPLWNS